METTILKNTIYKFIKNRRGDRIGVVLATKHENGGGGFLLGWSLCKKSDTFDKQLALNIAIGRALKYSSKRLPISLENEYDDMTHRAIQYFKE
jgi:hypothetical protein